MAQAQKVSEKEDVATLEKFTRLAKQEKTDLIVSLKVDKTTSFYFISKDGNVNKLPPDSEINKTFEEFNLLKFSKHVMERFETLRGEPVVPLEGLMLRQELRSALSSAYAFLLDNPKDADGQAKVAKSLQKSMEKVPDDHALRSNTHFDTAMRYLDQGKLRAGLEELGQIYALKTAIPKKV